MGHFPEKLFCRHCIPVQPSKMLLSIKTSEPFASTPLQQACERHLSSKQAPSSEEHTCTSHWSIQLPHLALLFLKVQLTTTVDWA